MKEGSGNSSTDCWRLLTLDLDQIAKFVNRLDGPLGEGNIKQSNSESV
jgi:hypothetical protein